MNLDLLLEQELNGAQLPALLYSEDKARRLIPLPPVEPYLVV